MVSIYGKTEPFIRNVMTLDTCAPIIGSEVMSHKLEEDLLDVNTTIFDRYLSLKKLRRFKDISVVIARDSGSTNQRFQYILKCLFAILFFDLKSFWELFYTPVWRIYFRIYNHVTIRWSTVNRNGPISSVKSIQTSSLDTIFAISIYLICLIELNI